MLNGPTRSLYFVQQPLEIICKQFPQSIIYHYIDNILLAKSSDKDVVENMFKAKNSAMLVVVVTDCSKKKKYKEESHLVIWVIVLGFYCCEQTP